MAQPAEEARLTRFVQYPARMTQPISDAEMQVMLTDQIARLDDLTRPTWKRFKVAPERIPLAGRGGRDAVVVARAGEEVVYFDDERDAFGRGEIEEGAVREIDLWGLDMALALRHFPRKRPSANSSE